MISMKRVFAIAMILSLAFSAVGCGGQGSVTNNQTNPPSEQQASTTPLTGNPLLDAELHENYVKSGSGSVIGQYACVVINKVQLRNITKYNYLEFCNKVVKANNYKWVTIKFNDNTGIQFNGSDYTIATYGTIDWQGIIQEDIGYVRQVAGGFEYEACN